MKSSLPAVIVTSAITSIVDILITSACTFSQTETITMIEFQTLLIFLTACLAINISPGPSIIYVTTAAMAQGVRAGILASFGLGIGILVHVIAAALGVSILLANSAFAFSIIKFAGAAYLAYLGLKILMSQPVQVEPSPGSTKQSPLKVLLKGAMVDLLNPKIAIFFLAFFPQFVVQDSGNSFLQIFVLGLVFIATGTTVNCIIAALVGRSAQKTGIIQNSFFARWLPGCVLLALSARMVTLEH